MPKNGDTIRPTSERKRVPKGLLGPEVKGFPFIPTAGGRALDEGRFVFLDPQGKRWRRWPLVIIAAVFVVFAGVLGFAYSLIVKAEARRTPTVSSGFEDLRAIRAFCESKPRFTGMNAGKTGTTPTVT